MIIDTEKLREVISNRDDNCDWEKCSISHLNYLEKRCLNSLAMLDKIEELAKTLLPETNVSCWNWKRIHNAML